MATAWEYREISAFASTLDHGTPQGVASEISRLWLSRLNELGSEGWELVSEVHAGPREPGGPHWSARSGTMKRPRQS